MPDVPGTPAKPTAEEVLAKIVDAYRKWERSTEIGGESRERQRRRVLEGAIKEGERFTRKLKLPGV